MVELTNADVATALDDYGRLLELSGESSFRVRAYLRAAEAIRYLGEPIANVAARRALTEIPGVGEGIAAAVGEMIDRGEFQPLAELQQTIPVTLLDLLAIPGVGARTVARLYSELEIADLDGLEAALISGRLQNIPGLGKKSESNIRAGLEALRRRTGRHRLGTMLPVGRRLVVDLERILPAGTCVSLAGSVRRMEETVADLDLVVGAADVSRAMIAVEEAPIVVQTIERTDDWLRLALSSGLSADLFFAPLQSFGTALVRATGSAGHLALLPPLPESATEEEIYASFDVPWIPPELREGRDELALARSGRIAQLVRVEDIRGELHCHTTWSDGSHSIAEMGAAAGARGYTYLGISDHTRSLGVANGLDRERLAAQREEIARVNRDSAVRLLTSAEVEVARDGRLDLDDETLAALDVVVASTHVGLRQPRPELTDRLIRILENRNVDIIAHPSGRLLEQREGGDFDWEAVFATAARTGIALEINADPARLDLSALHAREALAAGCLLAINCDAHMADGFALIEYGVANARRAGATPDQIINCLPLEQLEKWLAGRQGGT